MSETYPDDLDDDVAHSIADMYGLSGNLQAVAAIQYAFALGYCEKANEDPNEVQSS